MRIITVPLILVALAPAPGNAKATHPFSVHDMLAMERVGGPVLSPDGKTAVFTVSRTDLAANRRRSHLFLADTDRGATRQLTSHADGSDASPTWAPDGRSVFFLSGRSGSSQVWRIRIDGGEAQQVTHLPLDVGTFVLSRRGNLLAVGLQVFPDCDTVACTRKRLDARAREKATGRLFERVFIRHWDTWKDGRRSHLFVMPVAGGEPIDLMRGMDADAPTFPWGGTGEITFTPDDKGLVFTAKDVGREEAWSTNYDLFVAPVDGSRRPRKLTDNPAWDTQPVFSPDGKTLAYLAMEVPNYEADRYRVVLLPWPRGKPRVLTEAWDRSPAEMVWSADGKSLYATAADVGQVSLFAIDAQNGTVRTLLADGAVSQPQTASRHILFARHDLRSPAEIHRIGVDGKNLEQLTHFNDARVAAADMGEPRLFSFAGAGGDRVYGWVVKPARFNPRRKYPVALLIHGGPQGSFSNYFHYRWNPQAYAGAGYAVVTVDFHGSVGYGQAFTDSIRGDWGGKPFEDIQKGLAAALAENSYMDGTRVCALGASYGGFMVNWIAGSWPDRFRCLVNHDGNLDERFAYYATEELWFPERDHLGTPWENPDGYRKHNPVERVGDWKTPMLVVHGAQDFRVVDTQGMATFNALQRRGIPSQLLYFPDENHWVLKPHNSILWHDTVIGRLDRWTRK
jgi:dipeptidyl aminopeptidase/acylaminoacyl peptidase